MVITYTREGDLGVFVLEGHKNFENAKDAWRRFRQAIADDNLRAVLVHDGTANSISPVEIIEIEGWMRTLAFPPHIKLAIVDGRDPGISDNPFGETVVRNRGWSLISVFADEAAARTWLDQRGLSVADDQ